MERPLISVCVITYRQADFIADCLDGVISQVVDAPFEIIVGNDASPDATAAILQRYAEANSQRLRVINHPRNVGAKGNFRAVLEAVRGEYVAICEGDDFWVDPGKLQKQLGVFRAHPDTKLVFTNALVGQKVFGVWRIGAKRQAVEPIDDLQKRLWDGWFGVHTATIMFRADLLRDYLDPAYYRSDLLSGDWPLVFCAVHRGRVRHLTDYTAVYRRAAGSLMRSGDGGRIRLIRERVTWWHLFRGRFDPGGISEERIREVAARSMRHLGYVSSPPPGDVRIEGVGCFRKSPWRTAILSLKESLKSALFFFRSTAA